MASSRQRPYATHPKDRDWYRGVLAVLSMVKEPAVRARIIATVGLEELLIRARLDGTVGWTGLDRPAQKPLRPAARKTPTRPRPRPHRARPAGGGESRPRPRARASRRRQAPASR
jgi:hypothetical protein